MITVERLRELLDYDLSTGNFTWRLSRGTRRAGAKAGSRGNEGYWVIACDRRLYKAHRLAWLYVHGEWPKGEIDHANMVKDDNRIANLRDASPSQNRANRIIRPNNSGWKGITRRRKTGHWVAQIAINGKKIGLGTFNEPEAASEAYQAAARRYFGEFARFG